MNAGLFHTWDPKDPGYTFGQDSTLKNEESAHFKRIDVIFNCVDQPAKKVEATVLLDEEDEKTPSELWPSDHATVFADLEFDSKKEACGHDSSNNITTSYLLKSNLQAS